jgi:uncharacterized protein YjbI with pentapeptide repeats
MEADELLERYARGERDFRGVELIGDKYLEGADLSNANLSGANLRGAFLDSADLRCSNLSGANLSHANLCNADLSRISHLYNLTQNNLEYTNMDGADLNEAYLRGANLRGASLRDVNMSNAYLSPSEGQKAADLSETKLNNANLSNAYCEEVNFIEADLTGAKLYKTSLVRANLAYAKLNQADLTNVNLTDANLASADVTEANFSGAKIDGTILEYQKASEELQQKKQELIERVKILEGQLNSKSDFGQGLRLGYKTLLRAQQADFIQRLKSGNRLHCETEEQHRELTVISGERLHKLREFCWYMAEKYKQRSLVRDVFINNLKGKLGEEVVKARLGNFITEVDYKKRIWGDGKVDFTVTSVSDVGIQVKTRHGNIDTIRWEISSEEVEKNSVLVCILIQEEVSESQLEYHLNLVGFLPTNMIELKNGKASVAANELWYGGGLRSYLEEFHW